ncbi:MAG: ABC transporter permease [Pontiellaceae bacterium]|nr:ABC transporter permease [Pontiellaceae bacterium]
MIRVENIRKTYQMGKVEVRALDGVSLNVEQGEYVAIIGASGSGKSTLMHILGLLDVPDSGTFEIDRRNVMGFNESELAALRNRVMGFVFQQFNLLRRTSARENVALPLIYARAGQGPASASRMLELVGLGDRMEHHPNELSGGQQQRVAIARALVNNPSIILADEPTGNLDSKSAKEIMQVMSELHARGLTIILVTHDSDVANHAQRIIEIKDGKIVSDCANPNAPVVPRSAPKEEAKAGKQTFGLRTVREGFMLVRQSLRSLLANKVRTALSGLGIMIGVAAVIAVVSIGNGATAAIEKQLSNLGSNLLMLMPERRMSGGVRQASGSSSRLTVDDADAVRQEIAHVEYVSPVVDSAAQLKAGSKNWNCVVTGVATDYEMMHASTPDVGRFFTASEDTHRSRVALIGRTPLRELFGGENPIGQKLKINGQTFTIIGVLPEKGSSGFRDNDDVVLVPLQTAMYRLQGDRYVGRIEIQVDVADKMEAVQENTLALMAKRHRTGTRENPFQIHNMAEIQDTISATSKTMALLLSSIAAIALVVGGIGIMNIMLVSVTERTREIGLRKALGARRRDILTQFLIEALLVSFLGGCAGVAIGAGAGLTMSRASGWNVLITQDSILMAFGFSAIIGIVFGLWPARKAALLNPIEALRYE